MTKILTKHNMHYTFISTLTCQVLFLTAPYFTIKTNTIVFIIRKKLLFSLITRHHLHTTIWEELHFSNVASERESPGRLLRPRQVGDDYRLSSEFSSQMCRRTRPPSTTMTHLSWHLSSNIKRILCWICIG